MRIRMWLPLALAVATWLPARAEVGVRLLLGVTDQEPAKWDGSVRASSGRVTHLDPWRFNSGDEIDGTNWKASTRTVTTFLLRAQGIKPKVGSNGVIVWLTGEDENTTLTVETGQGNFDVRLGEVPYGKFHHYLNGKVAVDRVPPAWQLTNDRDEQDYPAVAKASNGDLWLAYVQFKHNPNHEKLRAPLKAAPTDFSQYTEPTGGDRIVVQHFSANRWSEPIPVTAEGGDVYRPAIAVDKSGRVWVFWSDNQKGDFDLWARPLINGQPGPPQQITHEAGSDVFPAAATDAAGRVWVAWQGWRAGVARIYSTVQTGDRFAPPVQISRSTSNEWNPSIAADNTGRVSVGWDSYRNGTYDIYVRTASRPGVWGAEVPVAATARYEAYPSLAYDGQGRLWIAYEEGGEGWGKDFGALASSGVSVYHARAVRIVGLNAAGQLLKLPVDVGEVLPGLTDQRDDAVTKQIESTTGWEKPDATLYTRRKPSEHPWPVNNVRNSLPRLTVDASGRLWLAFRSQNPVLWNVMGTVWTEYVASYDGKAWTGPIFLFRTDNTLDNRPAVVSRTAGDFVVIGSSDYRRDLDRLIKLGYSGGQQQGRGGVSPASLPDPYLNDLWTSIVNLPAAPAQVTAKASGNPPAPVAGSSAAAERATATKLRAHREQVNGDQLRIVRGEFHRHSEDSPDGGLDGSIIDQWRYIIDAAALDWVGCCDHDNGSGREYPWWTNQKLTDIFNAPGRFTSLFSYERSVSYPEGHRNVVFAQRGIRTLPRLPKTEPDSTGHAPDTQMFYAYLHKFNGVVASHTSATNMGTDWRDNDPVSEPVVEIFQGMRQNYERPDAPRANSEQDSIGGWRPKGFINLALELGYRLGFEASSDHISTHMSYAAVLAKDDTREAILDALHKRHVYAATDDILADVRSGTHVYGDAFSTTTPPGLSVRLSGTAPFAKVHIVKDNKYVYSIEPGTQEVNFHWRDNAPVPGKTSYYYVRGEQKNGEIVWVSPLWITYNGK